MRVIGLTGAIASGKSTVAAMLKARGIPVFDADASVHKLYSGSAAPAIEDAFPGAVVGGVVSRDRLAQAVLGNEEALARLEAIVHPLVKAERQEFLACARAQGAEIAVVEIPLLFESGAEDEFDAVVAVSAPEEILRRRAFARSAMTAQKFDAIRARQLPDAERLARADFVVDTGGALAETEAEVDRLLDELRRFAPRRRS